MVLNVLVDGCHASGSLKSGQGGCPDDDGEEAEHEERRPAHVVRGPTGPVEQLVHTRLFPPVAVRNHTPARPPHFGTCGALGKVTLLAGGIRMSA